MGCLFLERRDPEILPFVFSAARGGSSVTNYLPFVARAEKQKKQGCVAVAFHKQATINVVETASKIALASIL
jgi:hypothetical protein